MQDIRVDAIRLFDLGTTPVGGEVGAADEDEGEEEGDGPGDDDAEEGPADDVEGWGGSFGEDAAVEEEETAFGEAEGEDLEDFDWPECLVCI